MTVKNFSMFNSCRINGRGRGPVESESYRQERENFHALMDIKDPEPTDNRPDPNPVKTTRDHLGNVTKMEYQSQPTGMISPHLELDESD